MSRLSAAFRFLSKTGLVLHANKVFAEGQVHRHPLRPANSALHKFMPVKSNTQEISAKAFERARVQMNQKAMPPQRENRSGLSTGGSARVARASPGVAPGLSSNHLPDIPREKKFLGQGFRRDAETTCQQRVLPRTEGETGLPFQGADRSARSRRISACRIFRCALVKASCCISAGVRQAPPFAEILFSRTMNASVEIRWRVMECFTVTSGKISGAAS